MSNVPVIVKKKITSSKAQKSFDKLRKRVRNLKCQMVKMEADLEDGLRFYHNKLIPAQRKMQGALQECIKLFYNFYSRKTRSLTSREKELLKDLLLDTARRALGASPRNQRDPEIMTIYRTISGKDFDKEIDDQLNIQRAELEEEMRNQGFEMDLSDIDLQQDVESLKSKVAEKLQAAANVFEEKNSMSKKRLKKTKKQLEKEEAEARILERQNHGLSTIYKQLVKAVHPDFELDPSVKLEKEEFLKRVTVAYDNKDLCELLALELDWLDRSGDMSTTPTRKVKRKEMLEVYNSMLKDQVRELQFVLEIMPTSLRYMEIESFGQDSLNIMNNLQEELEIVEDQYSLYQQTATKLSGRAPLKSLRQVLQEYFGELVISDLDAFS